jgi:3',5'-cyclic AMP phosphodiesterase CpdA
VRRAAVLLGALAIFLPGAGQATLVEETRILAIGDFGVGGASQRDLGAAVRRFEARNRAQVLLALGDNDYTENPAAFRSNWDGSFGWARRRGLRVAGVLGNHDVRVDGGRYEFARLGMRGRYYSVSLREVQLFLLDSNDVDDTQTAWLARSLTQSTARWKLAAFHHPAFTCGKYGSHPGVLRRWVPLFQRHGVRLVLSGHDHSYQRFAPRRGVRYVVHGAGSAFSYPLATCPAGYPRRLRARREQGFLYLAVRPDRLEGWAVRVDGQRTDHFVIPG